eukprot:NODE_1931_length_694_cov_63.656085_g1881_i0.p1 GENE.NODE_1931_length_694_cov_63.656085_g1881_i0~~NODE_1931_length_694_cov_63.656085_g1881_i0.p1  ORF type:complete len:133 (-),score=20.45 NODE_1931_length_694_cov_63.656085_g1881_i0:189-587(-)
MIWYFSDNEPPRARGRGHTTAPVRAAVPKSYDIISGEDRELDDKAKDMFAALKAQKQKMREYYDVMGSSRSSAVVAAPRSSVAPASQRAPFALNLPVNEEASACDFPVLKNGRKRFGRAPGEPFGKKPPLLY